MDYPKLTYVLRDSEGELHELQLSDMTYMAADPNGNCFPGVMEMEIGTESAGPGMILGETFMKHFFTVFQRGTDTKQAQVGFATAKLGAIPKFDKSLAPAPQFAQKPPMPGVAGSLVRREPAPEAKVSAVVGAAGGVQTHAVGGARPWHP